MARITIYRDPLLDALRLQILFDERLAKELEQLSTLAVIYGNTWHFTDEVLELFYKSKERMSNG